jgi:hypothetical protein
LFVNLNKWLSGDLPVLSGFPTVRGFFIRLSEKDYGSPINIGVKETGRQVDASVKNHLQGVHMSLTVGLPHSAVVNIGGKSAAAADTLSDAASVRQPGEPVQDEKPVRMEQGAHAGENAEGTGSQQSVTAQLLLKRMQELQEQLREQQQQLAAAQAASFQSEEAKAVAVMALQSQITDTLSALMQVAASLAKELTGSGSIVSTTA